MSTQKIVTHRPVKTRDTAPNLFGYRPYWAKRFGSAPFLPMTRAEMEHVGWDSCDIVLVSGDAYVDHPSFGAAVIGRVLEAQGFRVGIIAQPRWRQADDFLALGKPKLFFGVTAGNMDSMVNRYTADKRRRSDDAYSPDARADMRPDRCVLVYAHRCREAYKDVPIVLGGIEASLRRIAHFDYWSETIRRSVLVDAKADILVYGNGERQIVEIAHRIAKGEPINTLQNIRGTAVLRKTIPDGWTAAKTTRLTASDSDSVYPDPYAGQSNTACASADGKLNQDERINTLRVSFDPVSTANHDRVYVRLPDYSIVKNDPVQYAQASRIFHIETNPGNARVIVQRHGSREVWINPPPLPLSTQELDQVFELPYTRKPHPSYQGRKIPAYEMIKYSVNIMRGCFGGCTFCSITEHEGRIIQSRSERSILREIETIRDEVPGFTGIISDLGGPTANMYRLACKSEAIEVACRRLSCVHPSICKNLNTDHQHLINLYQKARDLPGIKKILIASGLRYDLAIRSPKYVKELVTHHVGGYLKIAPEHTESGPLSVMMKPDMSSYDRFKKLFDKFSKEAGKEQYLIPYFIAAHPGTTDQDMLNLSLWLKQNGFRADQVQTFLPSPMAIATAMYHSGKNTLKKLKYESGNIPIPRGIKTRRLHKAFLRYHDAKNWPLLREALKKMGRSDLIGNGKKHLVPNWQPSSDMGRNTRKPTSKFATQHTGLPNFSDPQNRKSVKKRKRR